MTGRTSTRPYSASGTLAAMAIALAGSVLHEGYSWRLYAIHAGDGLVKIVLVTAILGLWRAR